MNILLIVFAINVFLLVCGITISWIDIHLFGSGLYLALVSIVTVVIVLAFCLVGTDEQTEPTVAKQMWSKSRQTLRRYTVRQHRAPGRPRTLLIEDAEEAEPEVTRGKAMVQIAECPRPRESAVCSVVQEVSDEEEMSIGEAVLQFDNSNVVYL